jgi:mono/diheme cytochrome c family protein
MKRTLFLTAIILVVSTGFGLFWYVKTHSFSAREKPNAVETYVARNLRRLAIPFGVVDMKNPLEPTPLTIAEARDHYADHCAICHANNGSGDTAISAGLYPPVPDMRNADTQKLTDGELLYIIKNGIRFTGMPGWGGSNAQNWKLVHFIRHLPKLTGEEIELMTEINGIENSNERIAH